jgi:hypothetical protein
MSRWVDGIAAVLAVGLVAGSTGDTLSVALDRAAFQWEKGNYVTALEAYQTILERPDAHQALESIALQTGGFFELTAVAKDGDGRSTTTKTSFYSLGTGYTAWERFDHNRINLVPEKNTYKPGDSARIMIQSPGNVRPRF